jgi:hypothetical protein
VRLTWRGHLVLIAGVAAFLLAGTAAGSNERTYIRQGGVVVAWVNGGGPMPHSWSYCDNEETLAYDGQDLTGRLYVDRKHDTLGWAVRVVGTNRWKVWANPKLTGRTVLVGSISHQSSSRWNIVRTARQRRYAQWVRVKPRLVAQAVGRDGDAAGASFLLQFGTCR